MPHALGGGHGEPAEAGLFTFYDVNLFQLIALGLLLVVFGAVLASFRSRTGTPWILRVFRGWCRWIRDEMVFAVMGADDGRKFAPYFIYLFFFIAFLNLIGLIPGSVTSTACIFVTGALAAITFAMMVVGGMMQQGVATFWKNLIPHGLPAPLVPLMFVLEVIGLLVKPFALTIRLFANMLAGHLVIYSFVGMIFLFYKMLEGSPAAYGPAVVAVGIGVFINIIEAFVAILQAYIFTFLSIVFVQASLHPHH
jgi:F-type H+-transporting ATPase subunit a